MDVANHGDRAVNLRGQVLLAVRFNHGQSARNPGVDKSAGLKRNRNQSSNPGSDFEEIEDENDGDNGGGSAPQSAQKQFSPLGKERRKRLQWNKVERMEFPIDQQPLSHASNLSSSSSQRLQRSSGVPGGKSSPPRCAVTKIPPNLCGV